MRRTEKTEKRGTAVGLKCALTGAKLVVFSLLVTFASPTEPAANEDVAAKFEAFEKK